jgi:hypothetical protein
VATPPLFAALAPARKVLIAGAGGGFDVYAFPPLGVERLRDAYRHLIDDLDLDALSIPGRCLYLDRIENTWGRRQVTTRITAFREEISPRIPRAYPH